jgi:hypothetical protein
MGVTIVAYAVPYIVGEAGVRLVSTSNTAFIFFAFDFWLLLLLTLTIWTWNSRSEYEFQIINQKLGKKIQKISSVAPKSINTKSHNGHPFSHW